jgi:hypothetical protein
MNASSPRAKQTLFARAIMVQDFIAKTLANTMPNACLIQAILSAQLFTKPLMILNTNSAQDMMLTEILGLTFILKII